MPQLVRKKPVSPFAQRMHELMPAGTDAVAIGSHCLASGEEEDFEGATMADASVRVAGIRYLLRGWIPLAWSRASWRNRARARVHSFCTASFA